ncbi:rod shape-determining protein [Burkholderia ubonensis]|uniref:Cell shape-determining protein MreB n=1 Tax=Burkholderia ubonensis TaxID=101571 RepID=A0AAW3NB73_9BURK|nr:rod shape-determining protein [Burkholderia ubonensis]KVT52561.1 rod shape-determining protein MreB [Burkholderia ubonensis]
MSSPLLQKLFIHDVAIDPGSANTLICVRERGVVLNQPSVLCWRRSGLTGPPRIEAVGEPAKALLGRAPAHLETVRPMQHGLIVDRLAAQHMIHEFIGMSHTRGLPGRRVEWTICVPSNATPIERRTIGEAVLAAGAPRVQLISEAIAAALGAGLPVDAAVGSMVVDIGGGTTEVAAIALGGILEHAGVRMGSDQFDAAIVQHVRNQYGVLLGEQMAECVKKTIGTASCAVPRRSMRVIGRGVRDGLPRTIEVSNHDIADALVAPLRAIVDVVKTVLERAPAEIVTDIANRGIVLTGGGAMLSELPQRLAREAGVPVRLAEEPLTCAVRGASKAAGRLLFAAE